MSNCDNDTNSQLKSLHARLDRVDSDLRSHHAAQYLQAIAFLANPVTAAQGTIMAAQFASKKAFNKLADSLPGVKEFKQLQHLESAALVDGLGDYLSDVAVGMAATAEDQLGTYIQQKLNAEIAYINAIQENAIAAVTDPLLATLNEATTSVDNVNKSIGAIQKFLKTLSDISSCQTENSVQKTADAGSSSNLSAEQKSAISAATKG